MTPTKSPCANTPLWDTPQNSQQVSQFASWRMPAWLSQQGPKPGQLQSWNHVLSTACIREPPHSAQAASNTYHLQLGLGRWGAHSTEQPTEKSAFPAEWQMGVVCLQTPFFPCLFGKRLRSSSPKSHLQPSTSDSGTSAVSPGSISRLQQSLSSHSSSLEQRGKLSWRVSKAGPALTPPSSPHLTSLGSPVPEAGWHPSIPGQQHFWDRQFNSPEHTDDAPKAHLQGCDFWLH